MKLVLKNVGKVKNASVEIKGITVIAGENDTGKSTVGKALFSIFNSFYDIDKKIVSERIESINNQLRMLLRDASLGLNFYVNTEEWAVEILKEIEAHNAGKKVLCELVYDHILYYDESIAANLTEDVIMEKAERICKQYSVSENEILKSILRRNLDAEFGGQVSNIYGDGKSYIQLKIRNDEVNIQLWDNQVADIDKYIKLGTEAIYVDDPFVLDELSYRTWNHNFRYLSHRSHLMGKLNTELSDTNIIDEIIANEKLEKILRKVSEVCTGNVVKEKRSMYRYQIGEQVLDVKNMSTGLKTFAILKKLLLNGCIEQNGTIVLDEPEIHLHPEWQLLFAELIVLLHKEFGLHILLNTHSPYFLNAIEVYAAKYDVENKCKYYLARSESKESYIEDVSDCIEEIYRKLARPLQELENERYQYD